VVLMIDCLQLQEEIYIFIFNSNGLISGFCHLMLPNVRFCILVIMLLTANVGEELNLANRQV